MSNEWKNYEAKDPWRLEGFRSFCDRVLIPVNGTWEDSTVKVNPAEDMAFIIGTLITRDAGLNGNKEIVAVLSGFLKESLRSALKKAYKDNISYGAKPCLEEKDYVYEMFGRVIENECLQNEHLRQKIVLIYKERYSEEYEMVRDFASTYENEKNDPNETAAKLYSIFTRSTNFETDTNRTRGYAMLVFMIDETIKCGHLLPYRQISPGIWPLEYELLEDDTLAERYSFVRATYDRINGYTGDYGEVKQEDVLSSSIFSTSFSNAWLEAVDGEKEKRNKRHLLHKKYIRERVRLLAEYLECGFDPASLDESKRNVAERLWEVGYKESRWRMIPCAVVADKSSYRIEYAVSAFEKSEKEDKEAWIQMMERYLIEMYFTTKLENILFETIDDKKYKTVTRHELIKELGTDDIVKDAEFLINMSFVASAYKAQNITQEMYLDCVDLTGEETTGAGKYKSLYRDEVSRKNKKIEEQQKEIETLKRVIDSLSQTGGSRVSETDKKLLGEIRNLENIIREKDTEIDKAETRSAELLEYIELMEAEDDADTEEAVEAPVDVSKLQEKRYVFVCQHVDNIYPDLRKIFPKSVFMETLSSAPAKGNIDAVVFITRHISHSLYFRAKSLYNGKQMIHFTKKNLNEMYKVINKELKIA